VKDKYSPRRLSKNLLIVLSFTLTLMISYIKYLTGPEWAMSAFYILPIILVTWNVGIGSGILLSIVSAISWLVADVMALDSFSNPVIPYINETFRLAVFLVIAYIIFKLKTALENQQGLAGTDPLTSVLNRRAFYPLAELELNTARRYRTPTSFVYLDIDDFKKINDHFGHRTGDTLLCSVAQSIKTHIRAIDLIVRFGGDEFGVLLSKTGSDSACQVVAKLRQGLLELVRSNGWPVTFSIGIATFPEPPEKTDEMIDAADAQMYIAKQEGKNRVRHKIITKRRKHHEYSGRL
jgi:diguanylate cyclase (GGDEF)-like protein